MEKPFEPVHCIESTVSVKSGGDDDDVNDTRGMKKKSPCLSPVKISINKRIPHGVNVAYST